MYRYVYKFETMDTKHRDINEAIIVDWHGSLKCVVGCVHRLVFADSTTFLC